MRWSWCLLIRFLEAESRYIALSQICSPIWLRSMTVPVGDGELPAARVTLKSTDPVLLAEHLVTAFASRAAVGANRAIGPDPRLEPFACEIVILKGRIIEIGGHGNCS